ncbi:N-acetylglucosamine-binding protein GbpA [Enterobacter bugandensis]
MKLTKLALTVALLSCSSAVLAHGYVDSPASRAYKCKLGQNTDCGAVQWEPQSLEQSSGFPGASLPPDGQLASAGKSSFSQLDKQDPTIWSKNSIKSGMNNFSWTLTARHKTTNFRYYITQQNWNQNQALTRSAFELKPFCEVNGYGAVPESRVTHSCNVPARTGYQVIYAVWEIADTANSFYQAIDVDFGNGGTSGDDVADAGWSQTLTGQLTGRNLKADDKVVARFFDDSGEVQGLRTALKIASASAGAVNQWSHDLAAAINTAHSEVRAGVKSADGNVEPAFGINNVYVKKESRLKSVAISYEEAQTPADDEASLNVTNVQATPLTKGEGTVSFTASAQGQVVLDAKVQNHAGDVVGYTTQTLDNTTAKITISLKGASAGHHMLKYYASSLDGTLISQDVVDLTLTDAGSAEPSTGKYDYTFPTNLRAYKAGTRVLQPKNGKIYTCRPAPYSGYCVQWSAYATQFEPGTGSAWNMAWTLAK